METYKKIKGFENYSVSDFGNVRNDKFGKCIKGRDNTNGYLRVCLIMKDDKKFDKLIHKKSEQQKRFYQILKIKNVLIILITTNLITI